MNSILTRIWTAVSANPRTTVPALLGAAAGALSHFGIVISPDFQGHIALLTITAIGLMAHDGGKDGGKESPPNEGVS